LAHLAPKTVVFCFSADNHVFNGANTAKQLTTGVGRVITSKLGIPPPRMGSAEVAEFVEMMKVSGSKTRYDALLEGDQRGARDCILYRNDKFQVFLRPHNILHRTSLDDAGNLFGMEVALLSLSLLNSLCREIGSRLVVAYFPTRESAVSRYLGDRGMETVRERDAFSRVRANEDQIISRVEAECRQADVSFVDMTADFAAAVPYGFYKADTDDIHPTAEGKEIIAYLMTEALRGLLE
jgi:hypothetical protein